METEVAFGPFVPVTPEPPAYPIVEVFEVDGVRKERRTFADGTIMDFN